MVADKRHDRVIELHERYGVDISTNVEAAREADVVVLVVKPQDLFGVVEEIAEELKPGALVVSLAAGVTTASLEQRLPEGTPVVRVMPNTPPWSIRGCRRSRRVHTARPSTWQWPCG